MATRATWASLRTVLYVTASALAYYLATRIAWVLCFPDSKVSLFFPPHAVLVCGLLLVPTRHWWAYVLSAVGVHFLATQQAGWPPDYALTCEAFDAVKCVLAAAGIRFPLPRAGRPHRDRAGWRNGTRRRCGAIGHPR